MFISENRISVFFLKCNLFINTPLVYMHLHSYTYTYSLYSQISSYVFIIILSWWFHDLNTIHPGLVLFVKLMVTIHSHSTTGVGILVLAYIHREWLFGRVGFLILIGAWYILGRYTNHVQVNYDNNSRPRNLMAYLHWLGRRVLDSNNRIGIHNIDRENYHFLAYAFQSFS